MSEGDTLRDLLMATPDDDLLLGVYADWLQEYKGLSHFGALRQGLIVRRHIRGVKDMTAAAGHLRPSSRWRFFLFDEILTYLKLRSSGDVQVYLIEGRCPPRVTSRKFARAKSSVVKYHVRVGARWIIKAVRELEKYEAITRAYVAPFGDTDFE